MYEENNGSMGTSPTSLPCSNEENSSKINRDDSQQVCKFWTNGNCFRGRTCPFLHPNRSEIVCKFFLKGNCKFGKVCINMHIRPKPGEKFYSSEVPINLAQDHKSTAASSGKITIAKKSSTSSSQLPSSSKNPVLYRAADPPKKNAWDTPLKTTTPNDLEKVGDENFDNYDPTNSFINPADVPLCPYYLHGYCMNDMFCQFVHGDTCEMCQTQSLHPYNEEERIKHHRECLTEHERAMEEAFAEAKSREKTCGICFEKIVEKGLRFGLLAKCKHSFCLNCIRSWRQRCEQFEAKTVRSCPECRVVSDFIIPSTKWVDGQVEKDTLVAEYHKNLKQKICKYTKAGAVDDCPFGNKCFYRHQNPDGSLAEGESPTALRRHRKIMLDLRREFLDDSSDNDSIMNDVINSLMITLESRHTTTSGNNSSSRAVDSDDF